jgi:nucleoside-diphosphate-sugar epimerase
MRVLVTGARGFVGRSLIPQLVKRGFEVIAVVRKVDPHLKYVGEVTLKAVGDFTSLDDWGALVRGADAVVHLSARVHVMNDDSINSYRIANVEVTKKLAAAAAAAGCRRFLFASSIKVNGERSARPFAADDDPNPQGAYGISKLEAEQALRVVAERSDMQVTVIRIPLVYGPEVGGNFLRIANLVLHGVWLPFGAIRNRRSLIGVGNLCDFICHDLATQPTVNVPALISDSQDISTPDLIRYIAAALQVRPRLFDVPVSALRLVGAALGLRAEISRLCDSLYIDPIPTMEKWNWRPPFSVMDSLDSMAQKLRNRDG